MSPPPPPLKPQHRNLGSSPHPIRRKRKLVSQGGQKWFKGSPRKRGPPPPVPPPLPTPTNLLGLESPPPLPPMLVQLMLDGVPEPVRVSVFDQILVIGKEEDEEDESGGGQSKRKRRVKEEEEEGEEQVKEEKKPLPKPMFHGIDDEYELTEVRPLSNAYIRWMEDVELEEEVEYHVDEEDSAWLEVLNKNREGGHPVSLEVMELLMDRLEKESYLQMQSSGLDQRPVIDDDAVCCICMDGECQNSNAILFCDMCNLAVHQECYGVPYIPEGQWLCRRCLQSPSREVECVLCPNKGGAFKQTDDGRWAHVVCAIWIPEVCFANTVFLEPIDSVNNIPPARWRLCCFICKYKGKGACIQCHKSNCYTAFHVTCAQHAGLCMRMDTVRVGSTVTVRKTAYCDNHAPPDFIKSRDGDSPTVRQKLKACRKMLAEKRSAKPTVSIPTIPPDRLTEIASSIPFARKNQFLKRLLSYWKLKRIQRNGVPLLRRLQAASNHPPASSHNRPHPSQADNSQSDHAWAYIVKLRRDLEKARLLCELTRKREKMKREFIACRIKEWEFKITPYVQFLCRIIDELGLRDQHAIFAEPVDSEEVKDYLDVIKNPMDLSTMRKRAQELYYESLEEMRRDFQLMIDNCLLYNSKETVFHRMGLKLQEAGRIIFKEAEKLQAQIGFDPVSRLHLDESPVATGQFPSPSRENEEQVFTDMDAFLNDVSRHELPRSEHIAKLEELHDKIIGLQNSGARTKRYLRLKKELYRVRRLENPSPKSPKREREASPKRAGNVITSDALTPRQLRRRQVSEVAYDSELEEVKGKDRQRPPKRRVVQESEEKGYSKRNSRVRGDSLSQNKSTSRRTTRLSSVETSDRECRKQIQPWTPCKTPMANGDLRNGREKASSLTPVRKKQSTVVVAPSTQQLNSFTVYRDTERQSSEGEQDEEDEEDEDVSEEEEESSSDEEEESESEDAYSPEDSESSAAPSPRVTRGGGDVISKFSWGEADDSSSEEEKEKGQLCPPHFVWAKHDTEYMYPGLVWDLENPPDYTRNTGALRDPPASVIAERPSGGRRRKEHNLVFFLHEGNSWRWCAEDEMQDLGVNPELDKHYLGMDKRKQVRRAYEMAVAHKTELEPLARAEANAR